MSQVKRIYVGMHDGVCAVISADGGRTWQPGPITPLAHAAARLTSSPTEPKRAYLAAYEAGVYRTDDGGLTWNRLDAYPSGYAHSVLAHPAEAETVYVGSEPAAVFCSSDGGNTWEEFSGFRTVPESTDGDSMLQPENLMCETCVLPPTTPITCTPALKLVEWCGPATAGLAGGNCRVSTPTFTV